MVHLLVSESMAQRKARTVFNADAEQLARVRSIVRSGRYDSTSAFLREAIADKLRDLENRVMAAQLVLACKGAVEDDDALMLSQAWDD
jgi:Arc/MetJ-type ribon-helix-helix transcriptional regulator